MSNSGYDSSDSFGGKAFHEFQSVMKSVEYRQGIKRSDLKKKLVEIERTSTSAAPGT